jgi:nucleoside-diphosphate-sugar epimerase
MSFWKNKKILITGGAGFIGSHLANNLIAEGARVTVIDNLQRGEKKNLSNQVNFFKYDLRFVDKKINKLFFKKDLIFHFASAVGRMEYYLKKQYEVLTDNINIDSNVIDCALKNNVNFFFYASSAHIYPLEKLIENKTLKESDDFPANPPISYGFGKLIAEKKLQYLNKENKNFRAYIGRYVGIFGPRQSYDLRNGSLIPALIYKIIKTPNKFNILTNGNEERSYLYIDDAINCTKLIFEKNKKLDKYIFNICSNMSMKVKNIAKKIILISKKDISLKLQKKKANIQKQLCDNSLAKHNLGWEIKTSFLSGLKKTYSDILLRSK